MYVIEFDVPTKDVVSVSESKDTESKIEFEEVDEDMTKSVDA